MPSIRYELNREGSGYKEFRSVENALINVVECDLSFGGRVTTFEDEKLVTETSVMGVVDICTYEGSVEDMAVLHQAAVVHAHMDKLLSRAGPGALTEKELEQVKKAFAGTERLYKEIGSLNVLGNVFHSAGRAKKIYMCMLKPNDEKEVLDLCNKTLSDVRALVLLKCVEKVAEEDFRALAYA